LERAISAAGLDFHGNPDAIDRCGEILSREFPIQPDDVNELPDHLYKG